MIYQSNMIELYARAMKRMNRQITVLMYSLLASMVVNVALLFYVVHVVKP